MKPAPPLRLLRILRRPSAPAGNAGPPILVEENLSRVVWQLAWPSVATMMLQFLNGLVDMFFVGRLGPASQAAVGMGGQVLMLLMSVLLAVLLSAVVGVPLWLLRRPVLHLMGAAPAVVEAGDAYLAITLLGITPYFLLLLLTAVFQGMGDLRTPLAVMLVVNGLNILGDALLVLGWGPFPALGVAGAAVASSLSRAVGALLAGWLLARTGLWRAAPGGWRPSRKWFGRILRIGNPAALHGILRSLGSTGYTRILADTAQGTAAIAALFIGLRAEGLGYMPGVAYGRAASTMVGQSLGAGRPERAERSGWLCTWQALGIMLVLSAGFFLFARPIAGWFSDEPAVVSLAADYLRINALSEPFLAFSIVLGGALQGAGDTRFQAVASVLMMWVLRLPATWWLCIHLGQGAVSAWWVMAVTTVLHGLLVAAWFRRGSWKSIEV